jgi:TonB family protein
LVVLLALLLHALVLVAFYFRPADESIEQRQTIEVSLETSAPTSTPVVEKRPTPPKPQPAEIPAVTPAPPVTPVAPPTPEVPPQPPTAQPVTSTPTSPPPTEEIQPLFRLTRQPKPLGKIEPVYPASERRAGLQASVVAEVTIDSQGNIQNVRILKSAGNAFDTAVIEALRKSTFAPGYIGDKAVPVRFQVPFRFNLN